MTARPAVTLAAVQMLPTPMSNVVNESQFSQFVVPRNVGTYAQVGACAGSSPDSHSRDVATALPASNWAVMEDMQAEGVDLNWCDVQHARRGSPAWLPCVESPTPEYAPVAGYSACMCSSGRAVGV